MRHVPSDKPLSNPESLDMEPKLMMAELCDRWREVTEMLDLKANVLTEHQKSQLQNEADRLADAVQALQFAFRGF